MPSPVIARVWTVIAALSLGACSEEVDPLISEACEACLVQPKDAGAEAGCREEAEDCNATPGCGVFVGCQFRTHCFDKPDDGVCETRANCYLEDDAGAAALAAAAYGRCARARCGEICGFPPPRDAGTD